VIVLSGLFKKVPVKVTVGNFVSV